jgi:AcrR family transcriptional regulator
MARDTRHRILVASLLLFNEQGVPRTTINDIADEIDISPGNLHYHFRKKEDIVDALTAEFQADARKVLHPPESDVVSLDDFWWFLHHLLELKAAYRFMLTDTEVLADDFPKVARVLHHFARGVNAMFELYVIALARNGLLSVDMQIVKNVARNLSVVALMSERFDEMTGAQQDADDAAIGVARSLLGLLQPYATAEAARGLEELATHYRE